MSRENHGDHEPVPAVEFRPVVVPGTATRGRRIKRLLGRSALHRWLLVALVAGALNWFSHRGERDPGRLAQVAQTKTPMPMTMLVSDSKLDDDDATDPLPARKAAATSAAIPSKSATKPAAAPVIPSTEAIEADASTKPVQPAAAKPATPVVAVEPAILPATAAPVADEPTPFTLPPRTAAKPAPSADDGTASDSTDDIVPARPARKARAAETVAARETVCFAGCQSQPMKVVYDRPPVALEPAVKPRLQLAVLGGTSTAAAAPAGSRQVLCMAGCYAGSRPMQLPMLHAVPALQWDYDSYDRPRRSAGRTAGRIVGRRRA